MRTLPLSILCCAFLSFAPPAVYGQSKAQRTIAITIDDLPAGGANRMIADELIALTSKLLATLKAENVPAVGFVNERKPYKAGEADARIKTMSLWLDNGFELGNHTFGHTSLNRVPLPVWEEEVIRGETVTKMLLAGHQQKLRYFRHPYLDTGRDLQTRREAEAFLISRGYRIAPVTMDAWDWMFGGVYDDAHKRDDKGLEEKLTAAYLEHTANVFDYFEQLSRNLFGYEPPQVLLLHGNWLEADHIGDLIELLRKRGYAFVTLDEALNDGAYSTPDEFVGVEGSSWLEHWAITRGQPPRDEPVFPQWVVNLANALPKEPPQAAIFY
jgi:peptidoglycan/xylan/chitin deacetylase (PgdA/CDA1 family)